MSTVIPTTQTPRTPEQVLAWFNANGITISGWAREHGFSRNAVNAMLYGYTLGRHGQAHRVAVALGLKAVPPVVSSDAVKDETNA